MFSSRLSLSLRSISHVPVLYNYASFNSINNQFSSIPSFKSSFHQLRFKSDQSQNKDGDMNEEGQDFRIVSVDRSKLYPDDQNRQVIPKTDNPLLRHLHSVIRYRGPISVETFIRECLTNRTCGYYMNNEVFGQRGDFVTSPDISPMFAELICLWCVDCWNLLGRPKNLKIVECGPGTGSLMKSFLQTAKKYSQFYESLSIHLVEVSTPLKYRQAENLNIPLPPRSQKYSSEIEKAKAEEEFFQKTHKNFDGNTVNWYSLVSHLPEQGPFIFLCQEFFDALPIHLFQYTQTGWQEVLVDSDPNDQNSFRLVHKQTRTDQILKDTFPELIPIRKIDETIEVSPESVLVMEQISRRIEMSQGAALIIDYGKNGPSSYSLRGIKSHQFVNFLQDPGKVDISVDVNFQSLSRVVTKSCKRTKVFGPVTQGHFLEDLGIQARLVKLLKVETDEDRAKSLISGYKRLCGVDEMGRVYKIMALSHFPDMVTPHGF